MRWNHRKFGTRVAKNALGKEKPTPPTRDGGGWMGKIQWGRAEQTNVSAVQKFQ
jgi:hypothetical protein